MAEATDPSSGLVGPTSAAVPLDPRIVKALASASDAQERLPAAWRASLLAELTALAPVTAESLPGAQTHEEALPASTTDVDPPWADPSGPPPEDDQRITPTPRRKPRRRVASILGGLGLLLCLGAVAISLGLGGLVPGQDGQHADARVSAVPGSSAPPGTRTAAGATAPRDVPAASAAASAAPAVEAVAPVAVAASTGNAVVVAASLPAPLPEAPRPAALPQPRPPVTPSPPEPVPATPQRVEPTGANQPPTGAAPATIATPSRSDKDVTMARAEPTPRPPSGNAVRWASMLELPRLDDVAWRLRLPMSAPIQFRSSGKTERAETCREALSMLQRGLLPASDQDVPAANFELTTCRAVALLVSARPATRSYLGDVAMSPPSARWLPPTLAAAPDAEAMRALQAAEAQGLMLAQLPGPLRLGTYGGALVVNDGRTEAGLFEMARGDFDGDGTEDLLVSVMERTLDNRFENTRLYLLTRSGVDMPLRVVRRVH